MPGSTFGGRTFSYYFLPTVIDYLVINLALAESPGRSYSRAIGGASIQWNGMIYREFENTRLDPDGMVETLAEAARWAWRAVRNG